MLKGKEFGAAIGEAIKKKLAKDGGPQSKAEIARHFKMKPPSLSDWVKKGAVAKDKLPELWRYFADVVDYNHWGMTKDEWPAGLVEASPKKMAGMHTINQSVARYGDDTAEVIQIMLEVSSERRRDILGVARLALTQDRIDKQNPRKLAGQ
jgi:hypothetical protein